MALIAGYEPYAWTYGNRYGPNMITGNRHAPAYNRFGSGYGGGYTSYYLTVYGPSYVAGYRPSYIANRPNAGAYGNLYAGNIPYASGYQWDSVNKKPYKEGYGVGYDTQKDTYLFSFWPWMQVLFQRTITFACNSSTFTMMYYW